MKSPWYVAIAARARVSQPATSPSARTTSGCAELDLEDRTSTHVGEVQHVERGVTGTERAPEVVELPAAVRACDSAESGQRPGELLSALRDRVGDEEREQLQLIAPSSHGRRPQLRFAARRAVERQAWKALPVEPTTDRHPVGRPTVGRATIAAAASRATAGERADRPR